MNNHSGLISNAGRSETLLNLASPPLIESKVAVIASFVISPSWSVYLFLLPGLSTTTLSLPSYLNSSPHFFSSSALSHMNFILAPRSIFLSNLAFNASNELISSLEGFSFVSRITHRVDSTPKQISLALLACISGTKIIYNCTYFSHPLFCGRRVQRTSSSRHKHFWVNVQELENIFEVKLLSIEKEWLFLACLNNNDCGELFNCVFADKGRIWTSNQTKVKLFLKGYTQAFVDHRGSFWLVGEQQDFGNAGILANESVDIGAGYFDRVGMQVFGGDFLEILSSEFFLNWTIVVPWRWRRGLERAE